MVNRFKIRNVFLLALVIIISISAAGCGVWSREDAKTKEIRLTEKLLKEKEVQMGKVYTQDDVIIAAISLKDTVQVEDGKRLAKRYADELRKSFNGKKVNVQAILKGKSIENISYE